MTIAGFQAISLLDYPDRPCAILFTQGCPFRCPYCHNAELIPPARGLNHDEDGILARLEKQRHLVGAVCVTGGEPTVQPDLLDFLHRLKERGFAVKLDTNGVHPQIVRQAIENRLVDYIAMDLKHVWERYGDVIRIGHEQVVRNCRETFALIQASKIDHEFRTTVCPGVHAERDFFTLAGYLKPGEKYFIQQVRRGKMLDPSLPAAAIDVLDLVARLQSAFPDRAIAAR